MDKYIKNKYLKYKHKYLELKQNAGSAMNPLKINMFDLIYNSNLQFMIDNKQSIKNIINMTRFKSNTPLMFLIMIGTDSQLSKFKDETLSFFEKKDKINLEKQSFPNETYKRMFELLLTLDIDINLQNNDGETLYFIACKYNNKEACKMLIKQYPDIDVNHVNKYNQRCMINIEPVNKPAEIQSHPIIQQTNGDCFVHAVTRCFIRTLQLLGVVKSIHHPYFYKLFYTIIISKFGCNDGSDPLIASIYLLNYLKDNCNETLFLINMDNINCNMYNSECVVNELSNVEKEYFIMRFRVIIDILFIGYEYYKVNISGPNYPTVAIKHMLTEKLQPVVAFNFSSELIKYPHNPSNLFPIVTDSDTIYKCEILPQTNELDAHCINLRRWLHDGIEFKDSFGKNKYKEGNFSIRNMRQLICNTNKSNYTDTNKSNYTDIHIICLMFGELPDIFFKPTNNRIKMLFYKTIDNNIPIVMNNYNCNQYGLLTGYNEYTYNNSKYSGEYMNGMRHGRGNMTFADGKKYEGDWKNNVIDGQGTMTFADGKIYEGEFKNNKIEGRGIMTFADGKIYKGQFKNNKLEGYGIMKYPNGIIKIYEGRWKNNKRNGNAFITDINGNRTKSIWNDNRQIRYETYNSPQKKKKDSTIRQTKVKKGIRLITDEIPIHTELKDVKKRLDFDD